MLVFLFYFEKLAQLAKGFGQPFSSLLQQMIWSTLSVRCRCDWLSPLARLVVSSLEALESCFAVGSSNEKVNPHLCP